MFLVDVKSTFLFEKFIGKFDCFKTYGIKYQAHKSWW